MTPSRFQIVCMAALLVVMPAWAAAQDGTPQQLARFRVLIPDLEPLEDADRGFGRDVAKALRELIGSMATHHAIERDDIRDSLDDVDLRIEDLDCVFTRQLAVRLDAQVALCASYSEPSRDRFTVEAVFFDVGSGESFAVTPAAGTRREDETVARHIFQQFDRYTAHLRAVANCEAFAASQQWDRALENCDNALNLNADALGARYRRARVLIELDRSAEALVELERVLQIDPAREEGLQLAGYVAGSLGRRADALQYYSRYLGFSPGNASVRMRVAYDLADAGDPEGALSLIREGLDRDPDNLNLWEQLGGYSFTIGETINRDYAANTGDGGGVAPDAVVNFRDAIDAYERVRAGRGTETAVRHLISIAVAYVRLEELSNAVLAASDALQIYPEEARLWSIYADALRGSDRLSLALDALSRVHEIDPEYPNIGLRRGSWLLEAQRPREAVDVLKDVASARPEHADGAARIIVADAFARGVQRENFDYAITWFTAAKELDGLSQDTVHQLNFWHGYSVFRAAIIEQEPRTLEVARATLPKFRQALELLNDVGEYPSTVNVDIRQQREAVETYIEIQEAVIRRGG